jgi:hypothetical protein
MTEKTSLPTLAELYTEDGLELAFKNDQFNQLLNQPPPSTWVKKHPFAKDVNYLPIDKVEYMRRKIFKRFKVEVIKWEQLFNSVAVQVRVHYIHPVYGEWDFQDGVGAVGIQTDKGALASDMSAIKQDAVMKALPAAESFAEKDAMEKLGKLFGADLNRKDVVEFTPEKSVTEAFTKSNKDKMGVQND